MVKRISSEYGVIRFTEEALPVLVNRTQVLNFEPVQVAIWPYTGSGILKVTIYF